MHKKMNYNHFGTFARRANHMGGYATNTLLAVLGLFSLLGIATSAAHAADLSWTYEYDAQGHLTRAIDGRGIATSYSYDSLGRRTQITQPPAVSGATAPQTTLGYDGQGQLKTVIDPRSLATTYTADGLGNTSALVSPDTGTATQSYNAAGQPTSRKDSRGVTASYSYDVLGRLTGIHYAGGGTTTQVDTYTYDEGSNGIGRMTSMAYPGGDTHWTYDAWGRVLSEVQRVGTVSLTVKKTYDTGGHVTSITYPSGRVLSIAYANGQPSALSLDGVAIANNITYQPFGPVAGWTWGNGSPYARSFDSYGRITGYPIGTEQRTLGYDAAGRIIAMTHSSAAFDQGYAYDDLDRLTQATAATTSRGYTYDLNGNRTAASIDGSSTTTSAYGVDASSNKLLSVASPGAGVSARSFSYDAMGNVTGDGSFAASYEARGRLNRMTAAGRTTAYTYDALGRRIYKTGGPAGTVDFVYDSDGKLLGEYSGTAQVYNDYVWLDDVLVAVVARPTETIRDNDGTGTTATAYVGSWTSATTPYGYQGADYRVHAAQANSTDSTTWNIAICCGDFKVFAKWPASATNSAHAVYRVTHTQGTTDVTVNQQANGGEWVLLGSFSMNAANAKVTLLPQDDGAVAADAVKAVKADASPSIYYVHTDHLGAPRAVLDNQNRLRWRWLSDPFGQLPPETDPSSLGAFSLNLRLPGQYADSESGLSYNFYRDYDPATGRYVQSDPIGLNGGINTYSYVGGNPLGATDPLGLFEVIRPGGLPSNFTDANTLLQRESFLRHMGELMQKQINSLCKGDRAKLQSIFDKWQVYVDPNASNMVKRVRGGYAETFYSRQQTRFNRSMFDLQFGVDPSASFIFAHEFRHLMDANNRISPAIDFTGNGPGERDADAWAKLFTADSCTCGSLQ